VVPARTEGGKRLYSQEQVDRLNKLHELTKLGNSISDIANLEENNLDDLLDKYAHIGKPNGQANSIANGVHRNVQRENIDINATMQNLLLALNAYKLDIISHELEKVIANLGPRDFALSIITPLLNEVGSMVDNGVINIGQEHSLSAILKFHIGHMLYGHIGKSSKSDLTVAIATPEGELHEFGIMVAALLCVHYNVNFFYMGPNMPADSLAEAAKQIDAKAIMLGVSKAYHQDPQRNFDEYASKLIENMKEDQELWIGGVSSRGKFLDQSHVEAIPTLQLLDNKLSKLVS
jgi:DNA-binding transcriptional MerR regulator/methylmalonyl-CoA mutase cobalamin-binding subunit